jgi:hypothetical protein
VVVNWLLSPTEFSQPASPWPISRNLESQLLGSRFMLIRLIQRIFTDLALSVRSAHTYSGYDNLDQFSTSSTLMSRRRQHDKANLHRTRVSMIDHVANPTPTISQLFLYDSSISSPLVSVSAASPRLPIIESLPSGPVTREATREV